MQQTHLYNDCRSNSESTATAPNSVYHFSLTLLNVKKLSTCKIAGANSPSLNWSFIILFFSLINPTSVCQADGEL